MEGTNLFKTYNSPVVIGGVGGSGTRLIAHFLQVLGYKTGADLNEANDNLWFTLLFIRKEILSCSEQEFDRMLHIFLAAMTGAEKISQEQSASLTPLAAKQRGQHSPAWLQERIATLQQQQYRIQPTEKWGWKTPNSHIIVDRLRQRMENMKYIHVMRSGLDMAHSTNQYQLRLWGDRFFSAPIEITPFYSLKFWCIVHRRIVEIGKSMGTNFLLLNYDRLCAQCPQEMERLCTFLDAPNNAAERLVPLIRPPGSIGRFKQYGTDIFDPEDVAYVASLGFDISP